MEKYYLTNKVAELRKQKGWSQKEFVDLLSLRMASAIEYVTYGHWERGIRSINATVAVEVSKLLEVSIKEVVVLK